MGGDTVEQSIAQRLPVTIQLGLMAILIGLVIAVPVGIYSAIRQDTAGDYVGQSLAILGLATPNFWLATMVIPRLTLGVGLAATAVNVLVARVRGLTPTAREITVAPCRSTRSTHSIRRSRNSSRTTPKAC